MAFTIIEGEIPRIFDTVISKNFEKREFWVEELAQYANTWPIWAVHDASTVLDSYKVGDKVQVVCQVRGNKYNKNGSDTCFLNLQMIRIMPWQEVRKDGARQPAQTTIAKNAVTPPIPLEPEPEKDESLPF